MNDAMIASSGNIFIDPGCPPEDAAVLQMCAELMVQATHVHRNKETYPGRCCENSMYQSIQSIGPDEGQMESIQPRYAGHACR